MVMYSLFVKKHVCIDILALKENLNILKGIMDSAHLPGPGPDSRCPGNTPKDTSSIPTMVCLILFMVISHHIGIPCNSCDIYFYR